MVPALVFSTIRPIQAFVVSTTTYFGVSTYVDFEDPVHSPVETAVLMDLELFGYSNNIEIHSKFRINVNSDEFRMAEIRVNWAPTDRVTVTAGRFGVDWSRAVFFPVTPLFSPSQMPSGSPIDTDRAATHAWLLSATWFGDRLYTRVHFSPTPPHFEFPSVESRWFPRESVPSIVGLVLPGRGRVFWYRDSIELRMVAPDSSLATLSLSAEIGASFARFDVAAVAYHGWDSRLVMAMDLPLKLDDDGMPVDFVVTVSPAYTRHAVIAAQAGGSIRAFWWWLEIAGIPKTVLARAAAATDAATVPAATVAGTGGVGWFLPNGFGSLVLESTYLTVFADASYVVPPLTRATAAFLEITPDRTTSRFRIGGVFEYPETGAAVTAEMVFTPHSQLEISLLGLTFFSSTKAFFRNFSEIHLVTARATIRF